MMRMISIEALLYTSYKHIIASTSPEFIVGPAKVDT